jgi:hypothetical protein
MFYINNYPLTVSSCDLGEEVPIILDIRNRGYLYGYEWYPNGELHTNKIGNIAPGTKEQSFYGDSHGLHILQYYCNEWSNYIYIYVV